jgi:hypothetical protein
LGEEPPQFALFTDPRELPGSFAALEITAKGSG